MSIENLKVVSLAFLQDKYYEGVLPKQYLDYFVKKYPAKSVLVKDCFELATKDKQYGFANLLTQFYCECFTNQELKKHYYLLQKTGADELANDFLALHQNNTELVKIENMGQFIIFRLANE